MSNSRDEGAVAALRTCVYVGEVTHLIAASGARRACHPSPALQADPGGPRGAQLRVPGGCGAGLGQGIDSTDCIPGASGRGQETQRHCADEGGLDNTTWTGAADVSARHGRFGTLLDGMDEDQAIYGSEGWGFESLRAR